MLSPILTDNTRKKEVVGRLRMTVKWLRTNVDDDDIYQMYLSSISIFQSSKNRDGKRLEDVLSTYFTTSGIRHHRQVPLDHDGIITFKTTLVDFVIVDVKHSLKVGSHISNYVVVSVKKTCRERWLQDDWTFRHRPKKYILFTLSNDYPDPIFKFFESDDRKIITSCPKKRDRRKYKLSPDDLLLELKP